MKHKQSFLGPVAVSIASISLLFTEHLGSPAFAFPVVDCVNQPSVIKVLDHIVWPIMDWFQLPWCIHHCLSGFSIPLSTSQHCGYIPSIHLETSSAYASNHSLLRKSQCITKCCTNRPSDWSILHLELIPTTLWQLQLLAVKPWIPYLR